MAEHDQTVEFPFLPHAPVRQKRAKGFASAGACEHQHIPAAGGGLRKPSTQHLGQMTLPLPGLDVCETVCFRKVKGWSFDDAATEDESF